MYSYPVVYPSILQSEQVEPKFQGGLFLQLVQLGVVASMNVPSGVSRAEYSVIISLVAHRPKAQIVTPLGAGSNGCSSIAGGAEAEYQGVR